MSSSCSQETMSVEKMALPCSSLRRWLVYQDQTGARAPEPLVFGVVAASSRCLSPPQLPAVLELHLPQLKHSCQHYPLCPRPFTSKGAWGSMRLRLSGRGLPGPSTPWCHSPPDNSWGSFLYLPFGTFQVTPVKVVETGESCNSSLWSWYPNLSWREYQETHSCLSVGLCGAVGVCTHYPNSN